MTEECTFKSAKDLGLSKKQWKALILTLLMMENGQIKHVSFLKYGQKDTLKGKHPFNMCEWQEAYGCGTVCCIGGSAEFFGGLPVQSLAIKAQWLSDVKDEHDLYRLFYEWKDDPTEKQAAQVLRHYLKTGKTDWPAVMYK